MKIFNINVNDFGGKNNHLEEFKKLYGARWCMNKWDKIDKTGVKKGILDEIDKYLPDIVIFQEFDINSSDASDFKDEMDMRGYKLFAEESEWRRPSMTVFFIKNQLECSRIITGHELNGRAFAIKVKANENDNIIIYGTHVPPKYNDGYWNEIVSFVGDINERYYILVGDFNTINYKNRERLINMLENIKAYDVWAEKGNKNPISIMGDYVIASETISPGEVEVLSDITDFSDHPIVKLELKLI